MLAHKKFGSKKMLVENNFLVKKNYGSKKMLVLKMLMEKNFGRKKMLVQKNFRSKKIDVHKNPSTSLTQALNLSGV